MVPRFLKNSHATLRRAVLRRFSNKKCFLEGLLEGACKGFSKDKVLRRVLRRERLIEGAYKAETRLFTEYDPPSRAP